MICTTKIQAERVALIGAAKMPGAGYQAVQSLMNPNVWKVIKADGKFYRVEIGKMPRTCSCAFYRANLQFQTCKHVRFVEAEAEAQAFCAALAAGVETDTKPSIYSAFTVSPTSVSAFAVR